MPMQLYVYMYSMHLCVRKNGSVKSVHLGTQRKMIFGHTNTQKFFRAIQVVQVLSDKISKKFLLLSIGMISNNFFLSSYN